MASLAQTNENYRVVKQNIRNIRLRIQLLNEKFQVVDNLEGNCTDGNVTINADSDIRRTCNITMVVTDASFEVNPGGKIWMDKYIKVFVGVDNLITGETNWINMGIYLINNPTRKYDASTNTLTFQALDLVSKLTGLRNGYINGVPTIIPAGESIREAMISTITQLGGFSNYVIADNPQKIPYELKFERASTVWDIIKTLRDISPNCQCYFDVNGVFHYDLITAYASDPVMVDNDIWDSNVTSVEVTTEFDYVKNDIEIWGKAHTPSVHIENVTVSGNTYSGDVTGLASIEEYVIMSFIPPYAVQNPQITLGSFGTFPILNEDGTPAEFTLPQGTLLAIQVNPGKKSFLYLGSTQIYANLKDTNPDSPFYVNGPVGDIKLVCTGGEYEKIWTDDLALQRAEYELYLHARLHDTITLKSVPVYWLDVNQKIEYINSNINLVPQKWNVQTQQYDLPSHFITKNIQMGLGPSATMTVKAMRFYPYFNWL